MDHLQHDREHEVVGRSMLKSYLSITKPGIIFGNLISVAAGFFLAAKTESVSVALLLATLTGVGLVIASGCVVNNIFDRDIDQKMKLNEEGNFCHQSYQESSSLVTHKDNQEAQRTQNQTKD